MKSQGTEIKFHYKRNFIIEAAEKMVKLEADGIIAPEYFSEVTILL